MSSDTLIAVSINLERRDNAFASQLYDEIFILITEKGFAQAPFGLQGIYDERNIYFHYLADTTNSIIENVEYELKELVARHAAMIETADLRVCDLSVDGETTDLMEDLQ